MCLLGKKGVFASLCGEFQFAFNKEFQITNKYMIHSMSFSLIHCFILTSEQLCLWEMFDEQKAQSALN